MALKEDYNRLDVPKERVREFLAIGGWAFVFAVKDPEIDILAETLAWGRVRGISTAHGEIVAVHASSGYPLAVPGGSSIPAAGLAWVGVHQGHRRQGLLTDMITDHFERSIARGEYVSTLFASEPAIYQRFGYGLACPALALTLTRGVALRDVPGAEALRVDITDADRERHGDVVVAVLQREARPGSPVDLPENMLLDRFRDIESWRDGAEPKRIAIVHDEHGPAAFGVFARTLKWGDGGPEGTTVVHQWVSATAAATHRLFSVLADLDL